MVGLRVVGTRESLQLLLLLLVLLLFNEVVDETPLVEPLVSGEEYELLALIVPIFVPLAGKLVQSNISCKIESTWAIP